MDTLKYLYFNQEFVQNEKKGYNLESYNTLLVFAKYMCTTIRMTNSKNYESLLCVLQHNFRTFLHALPQNKRKVLELIVYDESSSE